MSCEDREPGGVGLAESQGLRAAVCACQGNALRKSGCERATRPSRRLFYPRPANSPRHVEQRSTHTITTTLSTHSGTFDAWTRKCPKGISPWMGGEYEASKRREFVSR